MKIKPRGNFANFLPKPRIIVNDYPISGNKDRKGTKSEKTLITLLKTKKSPLGGKIKYQSK